MNNFIGISALHFRGFGDLTIYMSSKRRFTFYPNVNIEEILSKHLIELYNLLTCKKTRYTIMPYINKVPPLFAIRTSGFTDILMSLILLKKSIDELGPSLKSRSIFLDKCGFREKLFLFGKNVLTLPPAKNIYLAYESFFSQYGILSTNDVNAHPTILSKNKKIKIFPISNVHKKSFAEHFCRRLERILIELGLPYEFVFLAGEVFYSKLKSFQVIPRNFSSIHNSINDAWITICADSFPAHLAEFLQIRSIVYSYRPNIYFLPKSSFENELWGTFNDKDDKIATTISKGVTLS